MKTGRDRKGRVDRRARQMIKARGWTLTRTRPEHTRFVAETVVYEHEDDSVTRMFESDYTLEGLAKLIERRETEEVQIRAQVPA